MNTYTINWMGRINLNLVNMKLDICLNKFRLPHGGKIISDIAYVNVDYIIMICFDAENWISTIFSQN